MKRQFFLGRDVVVDIDNDKRERDIKGAIEMVTLI